MIDLKPRQKTMLKSIPTTLFSFRDGAFVAEVSTLHDYAFNSYIKLRNPKTGGEVEFDLAAIERDNDGDVRCWRFNSRSAKHADLSVVIFND